MHVCHLLIHKESEGSQNFQVASKYLHIMLATKRTPRCAGAHAMQHSGMGHSRQKAKGLAGQK